MGGKRPDAGAAEDCGIKLEADTRLLTENRTSS
jgi:hypothetical protein